MGEKAHGGATTAAERDERIRYAVARICSFEGDRAAATAVQTRFGCFRDTAYRYVRAAHAMIDCDRPEEVERWRTLVRSTLLWLLNKPGEDATSIRATLKQMTDLLGLAAPTRAEYVIAERPRDTLAEFAARPDLLERALQLEEELEDERSNSIPEQLGKAGLPAMAISGPSESPTAAGDEAVDRSDVQPVDCRDAGEAREEHLL